MSRIGNTLNTTTYLYSLSVLVLIEYLLCNGTIITQDKKCVFKYSCFTVELVFYEYIQLYRCMHINMCMCWSCA